MADDDDPLDPERIAGVSLEQFAGVTAALAEGFALPEILSQELIDHDVWSAGSRAWREVIADSPDVHVELIEKRRIAEDCLARTLAPLDDDPAAWMGLMGALASEDRKAVTNALGLSSADISRLGRRWNRKMKADPELAKQLERLAPSAKPPASIQAGRRVLKPFPWTPPPRPKDTPAEKPPSIPPSLLRLGEQTPEVHLATFQIDAPGMLSQEAASSEPRALSVLEQSTMLVSAFTPKKPATPFTKLEAEVHGISLVRYAELIAMLQAYPQQEAGVLNLFGLDEEKRAAIEDHYNKKFATDSRSAAEFSRVLVKATTAHAERRAIESGRMPVLYTGTTDISNPPASQDAREPPAPPAPAVPELGAEQYAWVTATLRKTHPERLNETLERLRLTTATRRALDDLWHARMAKDPALAEKVAAAVRRFLAMPG